jgi:hypothetical protein
MILMDNKLEYMRNGAVALPLTWWEGLCLFDVKKADQRQTEIK